MSRTVQTYGSQNAIYFYFVVLPWLEEDDLSLLASGCDVSACEP